MNKLAVTLFLFLSLANSLLAASANDLVFHATFDNTLVATNGAGALIAPLDGPPSPEYVTGRNGAGMALRTGGTNSHVNYPTAGIVTLDAGTISMWVRPDGWSTDDPQTADTNLRHFFDLAGAPAVTDPNPGYLSLYKFGAGSVYWLARLHDPVVQSYFTTPGLTNAAETYAWRSGVWAHLVATWSGNQMSLYVDGTYRGTTYTPKPNVLRAIHSLFRIGGQNQRGLSGTQDLSLDDVMLFREPLAPGEVAALYAGQTVVTPRPAPKLVIDAGGTFLSKSGNPTGARFTILGRKPAEAAALTIDYTIARKSDAVVVASGSVVAGDVQKTHVFGQQLADGDYILHANIRTPFAAADPVSFTVNAAPPWRNHGYGVGTTVPAGFEPVATYPLGATVKARNYEWQNKGLPVQITTGGKALLSRPMTLKATVNGTPYTMQTTWWHWGVRNDRRANFTADGTLGPVAVTVTGWIEFDGLLWTSIAISGNQFRVADLSLEIPMNAATATLMNARPFGNTDDIMLSGTVRNVSGALPPVPVMWVGNEDGGLQWSTNSVADWKLADRNKALELITGPTEVLTRLNFIDNEVTLGTQALRYNIGLQATPVRDYPWDVRSWELNLNRINTTAERRGWYFHYSNWNRLQQGEDGPWGYVYPGPFLQSDLNAQNAQNDYLTLYNHAHNLWTGDPVWAMQSLDWRGRYTGPLSGNAVSAEILHEDPSVRDYMAFLYRNLFDGLPNLENQITGLYLDVVQPVWQRDGDPTNDDPKPTLFSLLGSRELQQRLHANLKAQSTDLVTINHQSGDPIMSQLAFADAMLTGEHLAHPKLVTDFGYMNILTPDVMRAEYYGRNLGVPMIFLPEFIRTAGEGSTEAQRMLSNDGIAPTEHLVGITWLHDVILENFYMNPGPIAQAGRTKAAFGWDASTEFIPYWRNAAQWIDMYPTSPDLYVSVYQRPGRLLYVIQNNSPTARTIRVKPNWRAIGFKARLLIDAYYEQKLPAPPPGSAILPANSMGETPLTMAPWSFKALVLRN